MFARNLISGLTTFNKQHNKQHDSSGMFEQVHSHISQVFVFWEDTSNTHLMSNSVHDDPTICVLFRLRDGDGLPIILDIRLA